MEKQEKEPAILLARSVFPHNKTTLSLSLSFHSIDKTIRRGVFEVSHFLHSIWLFTYSDIKTIIATSVGFGLFTALGAGSFGINPEPSFTLSFQRLPMVLLWAWLNLLPFTINNQRQPDAILEDLINKPWRTMPSKRMDPEQAKLLMNFFYLLALCISARIGSIVQCMTLIGLGYWYNDARGGDKSCVMRNLINGAGFICFTSGALQLELAPLEWRAFLSPENRGLKWLAIIGGIVFTTIQLQDFYDQAGDSARGRKTVPLVIGDLPARYLTAVLMVSWGLFTPWYWGWLQKTHGSGVMHCAGVYLAGLACVIAVRNLSCRSVRADKMTFLLWNVWLVSQYALPLCARFGRTGKA